MIMARCSINEKRIVELSAVRCRISQSTHHCYNQQADLGGFMFIRIRDIV